jgi:hypothetical protein
MDNPAFRVASTTGARSGRFERQGQKRAEISLLDL